MVHINIPTNSIISIEERRYILLVFGVFNTSRLKYYSLPSQTQVQFGLLWEKNFEVPNAVK